MAKLNRKQQGMLAHAVMKKYERDPKTLLKALPEISAIIEAENTGAYGAPRGTFFELTGREEEERIEAYQAIAKDLGKKGTVVSKEQAIAALEHAAVLKEGSFHGSLVVTPGDVFRLVRLATGLSLEKKGKLRIGVVRREEASRRVSILMGIRANLSWDKRLVSIEVNPKELARRVKALSFVGIGRDSETDVARRHDEFLFEGKSG